MLFADADVTIRHINNAPIAAYGSRRERDIPRVSWTTALWRDAYFASESGSESLKVRFEANAPALLLLRAIPRNPTVSSNTVRSMTEPLVPRLRDVWPHDTKFQKRCFELLRAAYVKARYSRHYRITDEELAYLTERIEVLRQVVVDASEKRIAELRKAVDQA